MERKININASDIVYQLQQIDYVTLLKTLEPIILYYVTRNTIKTYILHKELKGRAVSTIDLPPEIIQQHSEIDKERLFQQQFGNAIVDFATTIIEKFPNSDLKLFYNNLTNLTTSTKNFALNNIIINTDTRGEYAPVKNEIRLQENNYRLTIDHELFHMSSTYIRESDGMIFSGFSQHAKGKNALANGINEGYTQLLAERYFAETKPILKAYVYEKIMAERLEMIIGKEKMESLYLNANLPGLVQELIQYADELAIMSFLTNVDFLVNHLTDKHFLPTEKSLLISKLKNADQFLTECYAKKLKIELNNSKLSPESLKEKLGTFMSKMGTSLTIGKRKFDFMTPEETLIIILKVLDKNEEDNQLKESSVIDETIINNTPQQNIEEQNNKRSH